MKSVVDGDYVCGMGVEQAWKDDDLQVISRTSANFALNPGPIQGARVSQVMFINQRGGPYSHVTIDYSADEKWTAG